jgi:pectin methylesterase-like acyl-CoA thioesterase
MWLFIRLKQLFVITLLLSMVKATTFNRAACQSAIPSQVKSLCPSNTIVVGPDGSFKTVQAAIRSIETSNESAVVLIQPGTYQEKINITRSTPITLLGSTSYPNDVSKNKVTILWRQATGTKETGNGDNAFTSTLTVSPTLDASLTGSGPTGHHVSEKTSFGNNDFRAYNIDFVNNFKPRSAGPSLAISVSRANAGLYYCSIRSYQDTVSFSLNLTEDFVPDSLGLRWQIGKCVFLWL